MNPGAQATQVEKPDAGVKVPILQFRHAVSVEYRPASHSLHTEAPVDDAVPFVHVEHTVCPASELYVPEAQGEQYVVLPANLPGSHR